MKNSYTYMISAIAVVILVGGLVALARTSTTTSEQPPVESANPTLAIDHTNYDFGSVSMAAGKVNHTFTVKNSGSEPVSFRKLYTSCMCTTGTLEIGDRKLGPFGMPGHGIVPGINATLVPGEEAKIEAVFDPAAHGPAGVGRIERNVILEGGNGKRLAVFSFSAQVTP